MVVDNETLDKVYTAKNHEELMDAYKDWAVNYDQDCVGSYGYVAHVSSAKALDKVLDDSSVDVLDAGCGTGLVGQALKELGYTNLHGLDYSKEMLEEAGKKGVYKELFQRDLSKPLDFEDNRYDAVVCTGTFTYGHVYAEAFDELARITKPGGVVCFTIREGAYEEIGYRKRMIELEKDEAWELLSMCDETYFEKEGGVTCKMCTYKVLDGAAS